MPVDDPKSESFSVLARAGLKVARGFLMLAFPKSTLDDASAERRAALARYAVDAGPIASIEEPVASGLQAVGAAA